jgi:hypothetical protein
MKTKIVPFSDIASHPLMSMSPQDYLGDPEYIKLLLRRFSNTDQVRLHYMLENNIVDIETLEKYAEELAQPMFDKATSIRTRVRNIKIMRSEIE